MATQRYISTSFWDDEWVQTLDPSEKLLYLYYMTSPLTNIAGVYKLTPKRVAFDTGFNLDTVNHIMQKFEKSRKAYRHGEYIILPNWPKHQQWEKRDGIRKGIAAVLKSLPEELIRFLSEAGYQFPGVEGGLMGGRTHQEPRYLDSDSDSDLDIDIDKDKNKNAVKPASDEKSVLFTAFRDSFHAKTDTTAWNWKIQGKHISALVSRAEKYPEPFNFAQKIMETYYGLIHGNDKFWSGQPFTPMNLNAEGIFNRVVAEVKRVEENEDAVKEVFGHGR